MGKGKRRRRFALPVISRERRPAATRPVGEGSATVSQKYAVAAWTTAQVVPTSARSVPLKAQITGKAAKKSVNEKTYGSTNRYREPDCRGRRCHLRLSGRRDPADLRRATRLKDQAHSGPPRAGRCPHGGGLCARQRT